MFCALSILPAKAMFVVVMVNRTTTSNWQIMESSFLPNYKCPPGRVPTGGGDPSESDGFFFLDENLKRNINYEFIFRRSARFVKNYPDSYAEKRFPYGRFQTTNHCHALR